MRSDMAYKALLLVILLALWMKVDATRSAVVDEVSSLESRVADIEGRVEEVARPVSSIEDDVSALKTDIRNIQIFGVQCMER